VIPDYGDKYDADGLFSPEDAIGVHGDGPPDVPPAVILGYQEGLHEAVRERADDPTTLIRSQKFYSLSDAVGFVPVNEFGIGAPVTATVTENVIAAGAETVIMLGGCACLQTEFTPDAAILPTRTVRDEGVSYHYVPADEPVTATPDLVDTLEDGFASAGFDTRRGPTWTTSAMYRETGPEIEHYRDEGFVSLCMESAALWAVCQYRGADAATVHEIGDYLAPDEWTPESDGERGLPEMLDPTVAALEEHVTAE
jgi:uridine phosphorylase